MLKNFSLIIIINKNVYVQYFSFILKLLIEFLLNEKNWKIFAIKMIKQLEIFKLKHFKILCLIYIK